MYKTQITGNTIIRKENRQHKGTDFQQQIFTYLIHIKKNFLQPHPQKPIKAGRLTLTGFRGFMDSF